jgi:hypothetical protein
MSTEALPDQKKHESDLSAALKRIELARSYPVPAANACRPKRSDWFKNLDVRNSSPQALSQSLPK